MKHKIFFGAALIASVTLLGAGCQQSLETEIAAQASVDSVPTFRVDPDWPQVPTQWRLGEVSSIAIDAEAVSYTHLTLPTILLV